MGLEGRRTFIVALLMPTEVGLLMLRSRAFLHFSPTKDHKILKFKSYYFNSETLPHFYFEQIGGIIGQSTQIVNILVNQHLFTIYRSCQSCSSVNQALSTNPKADRRSFNFYPPKNFIEFPEDLRIVLWRFQKDASYFRKTTKNISSWNILTHTV